MDPHSVYIHFPFCRSRCGYCDFNTTTGLERLIPAYIQSLRREIMAMGRAGPQNLPVHSVFFGGGTPSLLTGIQVKNVLDTIRQYYILLPDAEITVEANPGTVKLDTLQAWFQEGVNRLSFGMQSAHPEELRLLQRQHSFFDVIQAISWARKAGYANLNLDLIFGLPEQTLDHWQKSIAFALNLKPEHLSLYALTVEEGTPLHRWVNHGLVLSPDEDTSADMYEWADEYLASEGYIQYEISNWARNHSVTGKPSFCRHNLQYWGNKPYLGFGAGAHGYLDGYRMANISMVVDYIRACQLDKPLTYPIGPAVDTFTSIEPWVEMQETMMVGLRLTQLGVNEYDFERRFGKSLTDVFGFQIIRLIKSGLLEWTASIPRLLRLTHRGKLLGNRVFIEFIGKTED